MPQTSGDSNTQSSNDQLFRDCMRVISEAKKINIDVKEKFIKLFYERIRSIKREKYIIKSNNKLYDNIARLIVGDEICASITFYERILYVASNFSIEGKSPLNIRTEALFSYLNAFSKRTSLWEADDDYMGAIHLRSKVLEKLIEPHLNYFFSGKSSEIRKALLDFYNGISHDMHREFNFIYINAKVNKKTEEETTWDKEWTKCIGSLKEEAKNGSFKGKDFFSNHNENYLEYYERFSELLTRFLVDMTQLEEHVFFDKESELSRFSQQSDRRIVSLSGEEGVHAEIRILIFLEKQNALGALLKPSYTGISRLCCPNCAIVMKEYAPGVNQGYGPDESYFKGTHQNIARWRLPSFYKENQIFLQKLLGDELYAFFNEHEGQMIALGSKVISISSLKDFFFLIIETLASFSRKELVKLGVNNPQTKSDRGRSAPSISAIAYSANQAIYYVCLDEDEETGETLYYPDILDHPRYHEISDNEAYSSLSASQFIAQFHLDQYIPRLNFIRGGIVFTGEDLVDYCSENHEDWTLIQIAETYGFLECLSLAIDLQGTRWDQSKIPRKVFDLSSKGKVDYYQSFFAYLKSKEIDESQSSELNKSEIKKLESSLLSCLDLSGMPHGLFSTSIDKALDRPRSCPPALRF